MRPGRWIACAIGASAWAGCDGSEPAAFPEGGTSVGALNLSHDADADVYEARIGFGRYTLTANPQALDTCADGPSGMLGTSAPLDAGWPWLTLDGDRVDFEEVVMTTTDGEVLTGVAPLQLDPPPFGRVVGVGWPGGEDEDDDKNLEAFTEPDALEIPDALDLRRPDDAEVVAPGEDLEVRWRGASDGEVLLVVYVTEEVTVSCRVEDDGRFDIPADLLAAADGEATLFAAQRVAAWLEVRPDEYFTVATWHTARRTLTFE